MIIIHKAEDADQANEAANRTCAAPFAGKEKPRKEPVGKNVAKKEDVEA